MLPYTIESSVELLVLLTFVAAYSSIARFGPLTFGKVACNHQLWSWTMILARYRLTTPRVRHSQGPSFPGSAIPRAGHWG